MQIKKIVFLDDEEVYRALPCEMYYDVTRKLTDFGDGMCNVRSIYKETMREVMDTIDECPDEYTYTKDDLTGELQNVLGEAYEALINGDIDAVQLI